MEITWLLVGTGSLSSGSSIVCNSHPETSMNLNSRATYPPYFCCGVSLLRVTSRVSTANRGGKEVCQRWPRRSQKPKTPKSFHEKALAAIPLWVLPHSLKGAQLEAMK